VAGDRHPSVRVVRDETALLGSAGDGGLVERVGPGDTGKIGAGAGVLLCELVDDGVVDPLLDVLVLAERLRRQLPFDGQAGLADHRRRRLARQLRARLAPVGLLQQPAPQFGGGERSLADLIKVQQG
jgi:hypothetical protein